LEAANQLAKAAVAAAAAAAAAAAQTPFLQTVAGVC